MNSTFQKIPFLRITLAFSAGIVVAKNCAFSLWIVAVVIAAAFVLALFLNTKYSYKKEPWFGFFLLLLFAALGYTTFTQQNTNPPFYQSGTALATVLEKPQLKTNSYKSVLRINDVFTNSTAQKTNEKVLVYFAISHAAEQLEAGEQILTKTVPHEIKDSGTPYTFNYKNYLGNKQIYRQLYLKESEWLATNKYKTSLPILAEQIREKLLIIYRNQELGELQTQILSALTLGYKRDLDPETKRVFSAAGAMHVLAVSGLHVGILFMVFAFVFGFMQQRKTGKYIFTLCAILSLWAYAFITGLSPSVLRASTMFTLIIIGSNLNRRVSVYNSLAASALLLLLINSNNLFEVGFQLSYAAVFGIVFLQPRLAKLWPIRNKVGRFCWSLLTVSVAAQIATAPLTAFYFNQFPLYFWLTNFIVIPAATLLIPLGIALLAFSNIPLIAALFSILIRTIIEGVYISLSFIESLPASTLKDALYPLELVFLLAAFFMLFVFIATPRVRYLKGMLLTTLVFCTSILAHNFVQNQNNEIIVYTDSNTSIQLISGRATYVISAQPLSPEDFLYRQIESLTRKKRLRPPNFITFGRTYEDHLVFFDKDLLAFKGKTLVVDNVEKAARLSPEFFLVSKSRISPKQIIANETLVISKYYQPISHKIQNLHCLKNQGAFLQKW